jgi:tRNA A58 N-methylase Trm61
MSIPPGLRPFSRLLAGLVFVVLPATRAASITQGTLAAPAGQSSPYTTSVKTRDGLGKYYFGREIAHYMTHQGAPWLERAERDTEERPDLVMKALALKPGDLVADLGCGTGYFSWRMAQAVGPKGVVYGVEIQPEMLALLAANMRERSVTNVVGVLGALDDPKLPQPVDLAIMVDVYHECSEPAAFIAALSAAKRLGRLERRTSGNTRFW